MSHFPVLVILDDSRIGRSAERSDQVVHEVERLLGEYEEKDKWARTYYYFVRAVGTRRVRRRTR